RPGDAFEHRHPCLASICGLHCALFRETREGTATSPPCLAVTGSPPPPSSPYPRSTRGSYRWIHTYSGDSVSSTSTRPSSSGSSVTTWSSPSVVGIRSALSSLPGRSSVRSSVLPLPVGDQVTHTRRVGSSP